MPSTSGVSYSGASQPCPPLLRVQPVTLAADVKPSSAASVAGPSPAVAPSAGIHCAAPFDSPVPPAPKTRREQPSAPWAPRRRRRLGAGGHQCLPMPVAVLVGWDCEKNKRDTKFEKRRCTMPLTQENLFGSYLRTTSLRSQNISQKKAIDLVKNPRTHVNPPILHAHHPSCRKRLTLLQSLDPSDLPSGQVSLNAVGLALEVNLEVIPVLFGTLPVGTRMLLGLGIFQKWKKRPSSGIWSKEWYIFFFTKCCYAFWILWYDLNLTPSVTSQTPKIGLDTKKWCLGLFRAFYKDSSCFMFFCMSWTSFLWFLDGTRILGLPKV